MLLGMLAVTAVIAGLLGVTLKVDCLWSSKFHTAQVCWLRHREELMRGRTHAF